MSRIAFILGLAILAISNAVLLMRVEANRTGGPVQTIELTERELPMMPRGPEDSSVGLRVAWRGFLNRPGAAYPQGDSGNTFDSEKLRSLGFHLVTADDKAPEHRWPQRRLLYVALEYAADSSEEPAAGSAPDKGEARPLSVAASEGRRSRLKVVDAAGGFDQLRTRYPDPRRHLIVLGVVGVSITDAGQASGPRWVGRVEQILPSEIQVPLPYSREISPEPGETGKIRHYTVTVHYGRSLEPWVGSAKITAP